jgi:hypothetical protein
MPSSASRNRADQRVIPSRCGGRPSSASVAITPSISSITVGKALLAGLKADAWAICRK